jgi:hypothetical protein
MTTLHEMAAEAECEYLACAEQMRREGLIEGAYVSAACIVGSVAGVLIVILI